MFQFPGFPTYDYFIHRTFLDSSSRGLPHSEIHGSKLIYSSPWLIAVSHVFLRLPVPRHSPYALIRLNFFLYILVLSCVRFVSVLFRICFVKISPKAKLFFTLTKKPLIFINSFSLCWISPTVFLLRFSFSSLFGFQRSFFRALRALRNTFPRSVSASTYLPEPSPAKYCRH